MKKLFTLILFTLLYCNSVFSWEYLEIVDVNWWWGTAQGNIQTASCLIEPKGFYAECTLILEFSSSYGWYEEESELEVDMNFRLPANSHITDLHLWIDGEPIPADIYDRWTASLIYESIVQRRIDPAILTIVGGNEYNIKVYPLPANGTRKIQLRYLTPLDNPLNGNPIVQIPLNILKLSYEYPEKFKIAFRENDGYHSPRLRENAQTEFVFKQDEDFGGCWVTNLSDPGDFASLSLGFEQERSNAIQLSTFKDTEHGNMYYQLVLNHADIFEAGEHKKAVFLIDFINKNSQQYNKQNILNELKASLLNSFAEKDSFNIIFSGLSSIKAHNNWLSGRQETVDSLFEKLSTDMIGSFSNLPTLLFDGIDFIQNHGQNGVLILVASSNSNGDNVEANALIADLLKVSGSNKIPVHIVDLDDQYYDYNKMHYIGGQYYRGNEYLYSRLSQLTAGEYLSVRNISMPVMLDRVIHRSTGYFKSLEVFIQTQGGYTFSNYRMNSGNGFIFDDEPLCILGQYIGDAPFEVSVFGQNSSGELFFSKDTIPGDEIYASDSIIKTIWSANMIRDLMRLEQNNQIISQIIHASISERILCDYTAFLVLEPDFVLPDEILEEIETGDIENWSPVDIEEANGVEMVSLSNYPNPFKDKTSICYSIPESARVNISIYNSMGQLVRVLIDEDHEGGEYTVDLYGDDLEGGLYYGIMLVDDKVVKRIKLVVL